MKKIILCLLLLFLVKAVSGEIVLTEIMYDPTQGSDTDLEWVEIYNNGSSSVNLSLWTIDDKNFEDVTIKPNEFVVIARELIDGTDVDNESFESFYGNNDGVWNNLDGNFIALDGDFSLTDIDKINLSDGVYLETLEYNTSFGGNGNGFTIEKIDVNTGNFFDNWRQSKVSGGTPGYGNVQKDGSNNLGVLVDVAASTPLISLFNITDDNEETNVQIRPNVKTEKAILMDVIINSSAGLDNIESVNSEVGGRKTTFSKSYGLDQFSGVYNGSALMNYFDKPGIYKINLSVSDKFNNTNSLLVDFEYLGLLSISLDKNAVNFGRMEPGKSSSDKIKVINQGNVDIDLELFGNDLESGLNKINVSNLELNYDDKNRALDYRPSLIDFNLISGLEANKDLLVKLNLPITTMPSVYAGNINLVGIAK